MSNKDKNLDDIMFELFRTAADILIDELKDLGEENTEKVFEALGLSKEDIQVLKHYNMVNKVCEQVENTDMAKAVMDGIKAGFGGCE